MTRLHPAAPAARTLRALLGICAALVLAVVASGCANSAPPAPTPDPFAGLADRSDQAFRQGLEAYGQGQYREALTSFEEARLLSPTVDSRIDQMIERSRVSLAPKATPVPPTPTEIPVVPSPTQVAMSAQVPDTALGTRYFGPVSLGLVPSTDTDSPSAATFFFQDQIGLRIDGLKQHGKLPFTLRVFNLDASRMVAEVLSESADLASAQPTGAAAQPTSLSVLPGSTVAADPAGTATPAAAPASTASSPRLVRFWDTFVWYHQGGDTPGRYRLELFANGVLTNTFDYTVVNVPLPTPTPKPVPAEPTPEPIVSLPSPTDVPVPAAAPVTPRGASSSLAVVASEPAPTAEPTALPTPTIVPTPQTAFTTVVGGIPAGLDVDWTTGRFFLADASGVIWSSDALASSDGLLGQERPTLGTPINIGRWARSPVDLAVDSESGRILVSARQCAARQPNDLPGGCILVLDARSGQPITTISLPAAPGDLRVDSDLGLLYVALPQLQALAQVDLRSGRVRVIDRLPQITSLALDPLRHTLYAASLTGELAVLDVATGNVTARIALTGAGLASVATARGLAYAVNTATHELAVVEPISRAVVRYVLSQEPAAIAAAEDTGAIYVLSSRADAILRLDPSDGSEVGRVVIGKRTGHAATQPNDVQGLRPRLVLNAATDTVYATVPDLGFLAAVNGGSFPLLAREIPQPYIPDQAMAADVPEALWPAAVSGDPTIAQAQ